MNNHIKLVIASLVLFVAFAWADGPATLGNMIQLGQSTVANRPASSSTIKGALLFDLDAGVPIYNDGTAWQSMGGGSSGAGAYWYDGGAAGVAATSGSIFAKEFITNPDAGPSLTLRNGGIWFYDSSGTPNANAIQPQRATSGTGALGTLDILGPARVITNVANNIIGAPALTVVQNGGSAASGIVVDSLPSGTNSYAELMIRHNTNNRMSVAADSANVNMCTFAGIPLNFKISDATCSSIDLTLTTGGVLQSNQSSGNAAIKLTTTGAQIDFGAGTIDWAASNGGGITSPGTWTSTLAFASGVGVTAPRVQASGGALSSYTSANAGTGGVGALSFDTTMQAMKVQQTSSSFSPIAQPHLIYDAQTYSTRVTGPELPAPPEIAERVKVSTTATLQMYWTYTAGTVTTVGGKPVYPLVVAGNALGYGMTASSTATSTIQRITQSQYRPMWCQRVRTDVVTDALIFGGLSSAAPVAGGITAQTGTFAYLYYEAGNARWQLCTRDGVAAATCANTASVAASTSYLLCLRVTTTSVDALVDGVHVGSTSTNLPPSGTGLAPVIAMEAVNTAHTLYIGPMQVESY